MVKVKETSRIMHRFFIIGVGVKGMLSKSVLCHTTFILLGFNHSQLSFNHPSTASNTPAELSGTAFNQLPIKRYSWVPSTYWRHPSLKLCTTWATGCQEEDSSLRHPACQTYTTHSQKNSIAQKIYNNFSVIKVVLQIASPKNTIFLYILHPFEFTQNHAVYYTM